MTPNVRYKYKFLRVCTLHCILYIPKDGKLNIYIFLRVFTVYCTLLSVHCIPTEGRLKIYMYFYECILYNLHSNSTEDISSCVHCIL